MAKKTIALSSFIILVILSTSIYIFMPDKVRIDVKDTYTEYSIWNDGWDLATTEYVYLYDGSAKMRAKNRSISYETFGDITNIKRIANFKDEITLIQTYEFNSQVSDVELVPVTNKVECINCVGKILHYEFRDITYEGKTTEITSPFTFGKRMKLEWQDGAYYSKVFQQTYASDKIIIKYRPETNYELFEVRLFDPLGILLFDGSSSSNRTYELGTTINFTSNYSTLEILGNNYSVVNNTLLFTIPYLRYNQSDINGSGNVSTDEQVQIVNASVSIFGYGFNNTQITFNNNTHSFPGILNGEDLTQTEFIYAGSKYNRLNISFRSAESKTIYINFSNSGKIGRDGHFNFSVKSYPLDLENQLDYNENFFNVNQTSVYNGTSTNVSMPFKSYSDESQGITELFTNNLTRYKWYSSTEASFLKGYSGSDVPYCLSWYDYTETQGCLQSHCDYTECQSDPNIKSVDYTINNISYFNIQFFLNSDQGGRAYLDFTDGVTSVELGAGISQGHNGIWSCNSCYGRAFCNSTFKKINSTHWNITSQSKLWTNGGGSAAWCPSGIYSVASLGTNYYLKARMELTYCGYPGTACSATVQFNKFNINGPQLNKTANFTSGIEGVASSTHTGSFTTHLINKTTKNITRATLSAVTYVPDGTSIQYFLTNNNTGPWEETYLGEPHYFTTEGNEIRARFDLSSDSNFTSPIVYSYELEINPSDLQNLSVYISSNDFDGGWYVGNSSEEKYYEYNDLVINNWILNNCSIEEDGTCLTPIVFTSGSGGTLQIGNLNLTENINPINITTHITSNILVNSSPSVNFFDWLIDYYGNGNLSVVAYGNDTDTLYDRVLVKWSHFLLSYPSGVKSWQLFPKKRNESGIEPYGQNSSTGIWNFNSSAYDNEFDIYAKYNESIDSCVTKMEFRGQNFSVSPNWNVSTLNITNLTINPQILVGKMNSSMVANIRTYTMINCSGNTKPLIIPYFCFFSMCKECYRTVDWNDYCELYE